MIFTYKALDERGSQTEGTIDSQNKEIAITSLQRRGWTILSLEEAGQHKNILLTSSFSIFGGVKSKDVVILSRQMSTLFSAQVSALRIFQLLSSEIENPTLQRILVEVADDIQSGSPISTALAKHPKIFNTFYTNMVKAGEESGKLDETFLFLADYLERNYEVSAKVKNALIYPAFVITTFIAVMVLMLTVVIPKISVIITESGQEVPVYTKAVIGMSNFLVNFGPIFLILIVIFGFIYSKKISNSIY